MDETIKKQFDELKAEKPDVLLLFRVGDFYETYEDDAVTASDVLGITLTKHGGMRMCGFPHHALDTYLPKLVRAGHRVAICDQLKGITADEPASSQTFNSKRDMEKIQEVSLNKIRPSAMNPRKTFDQESLQELADNIKRQGLLQPITIRPVRDPLNKDRSVTPYEVVCGERRYRAVKLNGSETIPCIIREMTDEDAFDAMITENLQRKDVDPIEEAFAFGELAKMGKSIEEIANRFGKSKRFIADRIKLGNLIPEMKEWVTKGLMDIGAALHMAKLPEETQREALDEWEPDDVDDPVTKKDALDFTDRLFMFINRAPWKEDFEGSCRCACDKCEFNNSNAGCLFYEMKINREDAHCTNRDRFLAKRLDWLKHNVDENSDVLLKKGDQFETGKTVVGLLDLYSYGDDTEYKELKDYVNDQGFKTVDVTAVFDRWSSYREDDDRLQEKLANNKVYRVLVLERGYNGVNVSIRYYDFSKQQSDDDKAGAKAMQLVSEYKENIRKSKGNLSKEFRKAVQEFDTHEIAWKAFTDAEWEIFLTALINSSPYTIRETIMGKERDEAAFVKAHNTADDRDRIMREWLKGKLSDSGVEYYPTLQDCQSALIDEWGIDATEVRAKAAEKLAKKQSKIEAELTALGYDAEGKKLAF